MEKQESLWVCARCLAAIESHEGTQLTKKHTDVDCTEEEWDDGRCDWCEDDGFDELYELL